jgi:hypothetical protein
VATILFDSWLTGVYGHFLNLQKQIELIGIEIKGLNEQAKTGRFELKTKFINLP